MGRPSKPYPHRGYYQSIVNGVRVVLCPVADGFEAAARRLAEVKSGQHPSAPLGGATPQAGGAPRPKREGRSRRLPSPLRGPVVTVADAVAAGLAWARDYYRDQPGRPSKEYHTFAWP